MKRTLTLLAVALLAAWLAPEARTQQVSFDQVVSSGHTLHFESTYDNDNYLQVSGDNTLTGELSIPGSVTYLGEEYFVTAVKYFGFGSCTGLTSVTLPSTIQKIGGEAFYNCSGLTYINIPESVTEIEGEAFMYCYNLTVLQVPTTITSIGFQAFRDVPIVVWGNYNVVNNYGAKRMCAKLEDGFLYNDEAGTILAGCIPGYSSSITIPEGVTAIVASAFLGDTSITEISLPSTLANIGGYAFAGTSITELTIPAGVTNIGKSAFACPNLTTLNYNAVRAVVSNGNMFESLYYIEGNDTWLDPVDCQITTINIGDGVEVIPSRFLSGDTLLTEVVLPESLDSIGEYAFYGTGITELTIPAGVTYIGSCAFFCPNLTTLHYNAVNAQAAWCFIESTWYGDNPSISPISTLIIGDGVEAIPNCFLVVDTLLTEVTLPASVKTIGSDAFRDTRISSIVIPEGVESIGLNAFAAPTLTNVEYNATNVSQCGGWPFATDFISMPQLQTLTIGENVQVLPGNVFSSMNIESVEMPEGLLSIGYSAFRECYKLTTITIPDNVTTIGTSAFALEGSYGLTRHLTIGESVASIGDYAFYDNRFDTIFVRATEPPAAGSGTFQYVPANTRIVLPCNTLTDYEDAPFWSEFTRMAEADSCGNTITVLAADATMGSVSGGGIYSTGSVAILAAMPKANYGFAGWTDGSNENPRPVMVSGDTSYTANFTSMAGGIVHDTTTVTVHDTVHVNVPVHDTLTVEVPVHDTLVVGDGDTLIVHVHDTTTVEVPVYDTVVVDNSTVDTLWLTDTVYITITDTVYVHDTVYVPQDGIDDVQAVSAKIYQRGGAIVVESAEGNTVALYDAVGRMQAIKQADAQTITFEAPASGAYLVRIGNAAARRIVVVR